MKPTSVNFIGTYKSQDYQCHEENKNAQPLTITEVEYEGDYDYPIFTFNFSNGKSFYFEMKMYKSKEQLIDDVKDEVEYNVTDEEVEKAIDKAIKMLV